MSSSNKATYKPGTVARIRVKGRDEEFTAMRMGSGGKHDWWVSNERTITDDPYVADIRPLVVLDPQSIALDHLRSCKCDSSGNVPCSAARDLVEKIEAQTKPPRIPEPGLWGVVKASLNGKPTGVTSWVHHHTGWYRAADDEARPWSALVDPVLIREGVES